MFEQSTNPLQSVSKVYSKATPAAARSIVFLVILLLGHTVRANTTPVVFAFDAALQGVDRNNAIQTLLETSSQLTDETPFSLIIFDDVIQHVTPLNTMGAERLALLQKALEEASIMNTSNLAAGLERAQDELQNQLGGNIVMLTSAQITTITDDERAQYIEWYNSVLLPDIAERNIRLTFVTPAGQNENPLLQTALNYQGNSALISSNGTTSKNLLEILITSDDNEATQKQTHSLPDSSVTTNTTDASGKISASETNAGIENESDSTSTTQQTPSDSSSTINPTAINSPSTDKSSSVESAGSVLQNRQFLLNLWFISFGLVLFALVFWIWLNARRNTRTRIQGQSRDRTDTASVYLPLNETPSRHFDDMAESIDSLRSNDYDQNTPTTFPPNRSNHRSSRNRIRTTDSKEKSNKSLKRSRNSFLRRK